jgi:hypothetical protein
MALVTDWHGLVQRFRRGVLQVFNGSDDGAESRLLFLNPKSDTFFLDMFLFWEPGYWGKHVTAEERRKSATALLDDLDGVKDRQNWRLLLKVLSFRPPVVLLIVFRRNEKEPVVYVEFSTVDKEYQET